MFHWEYYIIHDNAYVELFLFFSVQKLLEEEKELANRQQELLDGNCKKYDMLETLVQNGTMKNLAQRYGINLDDWRVVRVLFPRAMATGVMME